LPEDGTLKDKKMDKMIGDKIEELKLKHYQKDKIKG